MARINIPGTKTDWLILRGYFNAMFTELYAHVTSAASWFLLLFNPSAKIAFPGSGVLQPTQNGRVYYGKLYAGSLVLSVAECNYNDWCHGVLIGDTEPVISNATMLANSDPFTAGNIMMFYIQKSASGFVYMYLDFGQSDSSDIPESSDIILPESSDLPISESSDFVLESSDSSLTQLSAPTAGIITNITQTGFRAPVSGVDANASGLDIFIGGVKYGSTLPRITTYVDVTSRTAGTNYAVTFKAIGDGVAYSDSNISNQVTVDTLTLFIVSTTILPATSTDGTYLDITFNKNCASGTSGITLKVGGVSKTFTYSVVSNKLRVTPTVAFLSTDVITLDYSSGNVTASDGTSLEVFTEKSVTNNTILVYINWDLFSNMHFNTNKLYNDATGINGAASSQILQDGQAIYMQGYVGIKDYTTLGLYSAHSIRQYNQMSCSMTMTSGFLSYYDSSAVKQTTANTMNATYGGVPSHLALARIRRAGNQYILEYQFDNSSWSTVYTWTNNNPLYIVACMAYSLNDYILEPKVF